ncbi:MAG: hypothetical protein IKB86_06735 [Clostridia bacterium]|nr:hypothetical protein [Clostridia bacterium]
MKKLLVALMAICIVFSCFGVVSFAEAEATGETKTVDALIGAYYLQGENGYGYAPGGVQYTFETYPKKHDYTIADKMAELLTGTDRIPFYAYDVDGKVFFDKYAQDYHLSEINAAAAAGIDFMAYRYYAGVDKSFFGSEQRVTALSNMNHQLKRHQTLYSMNAYDKDVKYATVIDGDLKSNKSVDIETYVDQFLITKGCLTSSDGRPVVFVIWNDDIENQIKKINRRVKIVVSNGANDKKADYPETPLDPSIEKAYFVALNAPSYAEAIAKGADTVSWYEGSGKNGEAYANMAATVEAKWATADKAIPNVVTGFDKTILANNPIEIKTNKYSDDAEVTVRFSRSGAADESVAKATPTEIVDQLKKAVATTNKPAELNAVMMYAWDDFLGGAYLCPTKTDKANQYDMSYLTAMREYFYGKAEGMTSLAVLNNDGNRVVTDADGTVTTYKGSTDEILSKVDKDGNVIATPAPDNNDDSQGGDNGNNSADNGWILYVAIGAAVVVVAAVVIIIVASKGKKKATK